MPYGPETVPYSLEFVGKVIAGQSPFDESSRADVNTATALVKRLASSASLLLPRLLTCTLGKLRELMLLTIVDGVSLGSGVEGVLAAPTLPSPPASRLHHLICKKALEDGIDYATYSGSGAVQHAHLSNGATVVGARAKTADGEAAEYTLGAKAKASEGDGKITFYEMATDGGGFIADRPTWTCDGGKWTSVLESSRTTVQVDVPTMLEDGAHGGPPSGFLVVLLSSQAADDALNLQLLRELSAARQVVDKRCWGVQILSPSPNFDATWQAGISTAEEPPPPKHSDLVALQCT
jgi:hypothetical protein